MNKDDKVLRINCFKEFNIDSSNSFNGSSSNFSDTNQISKIYLNDNRCFVSHSEVKIPQSEHYPIKSFPSVHAVDINVSYLSTEFYLIKTWVEIESHGNAPLKSGVTDSDDLSLIEYAQILDECAIKESPLQPKFQRIDTKIINILGYIIILIYLLNAAALSDDERSVDIIRIDMKFQIMKHLTCGYLLGRDVLKVYKIIIDKDVG